MKLNWNWNWTSVLKMSIFKLTKQFFKIILSFIWIQINLKSRILKSVRIPNTACDKGIWLATIRMNACLTDRLSDCTAIWLSDYLTTLLSIGSRSALCTRYFGLLSDCCQSPGSHFCTSDLSALTYVSYLEACMLILLSASLKVRLSSFRKCLSIFIACCGSGSAWHYIISATFKSS